jgi:hypothetical protein
VQGRTEYKDALVRFVPSRKFEVYPIRQLMRTPREISSRSAVFYFEEGFDHST